MDAAEKVREARLRRMLSRRGFTLSRSRRRDPGALDYGRYTILRDGEPVITVAALDVVEQWIAKHDWLQSGQAGVTEQSFAFAPGAFDGVLPASVPVRYGEGGPVIGGAIAEVTSGDKGLHTKITMPRVPGEQE